MKQKILLILIVCIAVFGGAWWLNRSTQFSSTNTRIAPETFTSTPTPPGAEEAPATFGDMLRSMVPTSEPSPTPATSVSIPTLPERTILSGGDHVFQTFNNCGPASLSMLLSHFGVQVTQQELGQQLRPYQNAQGDNDDKSVTLDEVAEKAREYGFLVYHRPAGNMQILKQFIAQGMPVLTRTWLSPGEDIGHFRVVRGYDNATGEIIQDDSLQGEGLRYSEAAFLELWEPFNSEFLVLVPEEKQPLTEAILGDLLDEQIAWQRSLQLAETAQSQDPTDAYAVFNAAVAHYHLGEYAEAVSTYESVENQLPSRMLWYQIEPLLAYWRLGEDGEVLQRTERILSNQNRAFSELHYLRATIFEKQGNQAAADAAYQLAEQYNSTNSWRVNVAE